MLDVNSTPAGADRIDADCRARRGACGSVRVKRCACPGGKVSDW